MPFREQWHPALESISRTYGEQQYRVNRRGCCSQAIALTENCWVMLCAHRGTTLRRNNYLSARYLELRVQGGGRVFSGPDIEGSRFDVPGLGLRTPETQLVGAKRKCESLGLSRRHRDPPESLQLAHWPRGRSRTLMNVDLRDHITRGLAS